MSRIAYMLFYAAAVVAALSALTGMIRGDGRRDAAFPGSSVPELEEFVLSFYRSLDDGDYGTVAAQSVEGRWTKGRRPREYHFGGILGHDELRDNLLADYGKNGWMIRFVTLRALSGELLPDGSPFPSELKRENEIAAYLEYMRGMPLRKGFVALTGHVTGRCTIIGWERRVPVVHVDGSWIILSRGAPDDYQPVRREQWFTPVKF